VSDYDWCEDQLDLNSEYRIQIPTTDPKYVYSGQYWVLITVDRFIDSTEAVFMIKMSAGDENIVLVDGVFAEATGSARFDVPATNGDDTYVCVEGDFY
jgi:hypothetical protein